MIPICHRSAEKAAINITKANPAKAKINVLDGSVTANGALGAPSDKYPNTNWTPKSFASLSDKTKTLDTLKKELEIAKKSTTTRKEEVESLHERVLGLNAQILQHITQIVALEDELITKDSELGNLEGEYSEREISNVYIKTTPGRILLNQSFEYKE